MGSALEIAKQLIARPSITPDDKGCQELLIQKLKNLDFTIERLRFGEVDNFWAQRGNSQPLFLFAGHTDVVPPGDLDHWDSSPFTPSIRDGHLYGRGAADMKGGIAAMVAACEVFISQHPQHPGSIAFLITSDEEGPAINGTAKVVEHIQEQNRQIDWCLIGEATSVNNLGDMVKNGRRGSLSAELTIHGVQGHIAYPDMTENPIHKALAALQELVNTAWDAGNEYFQPTSFQISNIHGGVGATNVIPDKLTVFFNLRYTTETDARTLEERIEHILQQHQLKFDINWDLAGKPFLTPKGTLLSAVKSAINDIVGIDTKISTIGGTSDGRFIADTGCEIIELGPLIDTIHKVNECINITDLENLSKIYLRMLERLLIK